jgi:hypothetical protein
MDCKIEEAEWVGKRGEDDGQKTRHPDGQKEDDGRII